MLRKLFLSISIITHFIFGISCFFVLGYKELYDNELNSLFDNLSVNLYQDRLYNELDYYGSKVAPINFTSINVHNSPASPQAFCDENPHRRIIFIGPPGSGKGSQASKFKDESLCHLSVGDMLRKAVKAGNISKTENGKFCDNDIVFGIMIGAIKSDSCKCGFILDGFPRNVEQAEILDQFLKNKSLEIDKVINLTIDDDVLVRRISGRMVHPASGRIYNSLSMPPKYPGKDDITGENLVKREGDTEEILLFRLEEFYNKTAPLVEYYGAKVAIINADNDPESVSDEIMAALSSSSSSKVMFSLDSSTVKKMIIKALSQFEFIYERLDNNSLEVQMAQFYQQSAQRLEDRLHSIMMDNCNSTYLGQVLSRLYDNSSGLHNLLYTNYTGLKELVSTIRSYPDDIFLCTNRLVINSFKTTLVFTSDHNQAENATTNEIGINIFKGKEIKINRHLRHTHAYGELFCNYAGSYINKNFVINEKGVDTGGEVLYSAVRQCGLDFGKLILSNDSYLHLKSINDYRDGICYFIPEGQIHQLANISELVLTIYSKDNRDILEKCVHKVYSNEDQLTYLESLLAGYNPTIHRHASYQWLKEVMKIHDYLSTGQV